MNEWFDAESHVQRAQQLYEDGRLDEAENELREALALNPYKSEWHYNLGLTLEAAGRFDDALKAFRDCYALDEDDPQVMLCIGSNLMRTRQPREAIDWFEKVAKADPTNTDAFTQRIRAFAEIGDHEQAEVMFYMAQQVNPKDATAYVHLADSLQTRGLQDKAVWCLREAAALNPTLPGIYARLAQGYALTGRLERARQLYLRELRTDPGDIQTLLDLGTLLVQMNRLQEASEKFRRVLELEPDHPEAHFHLADLNERQGQAALAMEQFRVVLRLDERFPGVRRRIAALLLRIGAPGDREQARELLVREVAFTQTAESGVTPEVLSDLGATLLDAGMHHEAKGVLELCIRGRGGSAQVRELHLYSVALLQSGSREDGMNACREALRIDPKFVPAMHNLAVACVLDHQWHKARYWVRQGLLVNPDDAPLRRLRLKLRLHAFAEFGAWAAAPLRVLKRRRRGNQT